MAIIPKYNRQVREGGVDRSRTQLNVPTETPEAQTLQNQAKGSAMMGETIDKAVNYAEQRYEQYNQGVANEAAFKAKQGINLAYSQYMKTKGFGTQEGIKEYHKNIKEMNSVNLSKLNGRQKKLYTEAIQIYQETKYSSAINYQALQMSNAEVKAAQMNLKANQSIFATDGAFDEVSFRKNVKILNKGLKDDDMEIAIKATFNSYAEARVTFVSNDVNSKAAIKELNEFKDDKLINNSTYDILRNKLNDGLIREDISEEYEESGPVKTLNSIKENYSGNDRKVAMAEYNAKKQESHQREVATTDALTYGRSEKMQQALQQGDIIALGKINLSDYDNYPRIRAAIERTLHRGYFANTTDGATYGNLYKIYQGLSRSNPMSLEPILENIDKLSSDDINTLIKLHTKASSGTSSLGNTRLPGQISYNDFLKNFLLLTNVDREDFVQGKYSAGNVGRAFKEYQKEVTEKKTTDADALTAATDWFNKIGTTEVTTGGFYFDFAGPDWEQLKNIGDMDNPIFFTEEAYNKDRARKQKLSGSNKKELTEAQKVERDINKYTPGSGR